MSVRHKTGLAAIAVLMSAAPACAQSYLQYRCDDGAQISVAFVEKAKSAYVQLDGKAIALPLRISASGSRYAKSGVTFWVKGNEAQLKRPKRAWTNCKMV